MCRYCMPYGMCRCIGGLCCGLRHGRSLSGIGSNPPRWSLVGISILRPDFKFVIALRADNVYGLSARRAVLQDIEGSAVPEVGSFEQIDKLLALRAVAIQLEVPCRGNGGRLAHRVRCHVALLGNKDLRKSSSLFAARAIAPSSSSYSA